MQKKQTIQEEAEMLLNKQLREYKINKLVKFLDIIHCRKTWIAEAKRKARCSNIDHVNRWKWEIKKTKKEIKRVKKLTYIPS